MTRFGSLTMLNSECPSSCSNDDHFRFHELLHFEIVQTNRNLRGIKRCRCSFQFFAKNSISPADYGATNFMFLFGISVQMWLQVCI